MGYCAQPTPEMGEYSVEVREESFYLRGEDSYGVDAVPHGIFVYPSHDSRQGTAEIPIEDIPKIRAALDQAERVASGKKLPTD